MLTPGDWVEQRYRVAGVVAAGGTAIIYRVQTRQGAVRALKLPRRTVPELVARLRQEARVLALLQHPNIVAIEDTVEVGGLPGLILELVSEGRTLASVITESRGLMSVSRLRHIGTQLIDALAAVHAAGIVHRDVKPSNVLLDGDRALLCDFGLAKLHSSDPLVVTQVGSAMGTPPFMAPEQVGGMGSVEPAADIFSLGALLFELVTGVRAFTGLTDEEVIEAAREGRRADVRVLRPDTPTSMVRAIELALVPERDRRTVTLQQMRLLWEGSSSSNRPPSATPTIGNVSVPLIPLIGRDDLVADILSSLAASKRFLLLHGPGGIGKSLLASHVATQSGALYPAGAWWVSCRGLEAGTELSQRWRALGVEAAMATGKRVLVVLDAIEQLGPSALERISRALAACPGLRVLATSRTRIAIQGSVVRVPPLESDDSMTLLLACAQREGADLGYTRRALRRLVSLMDGLPLAIEVVAPWLMLHAPDDLADQISEYGRIRSLGLSDRRNPLADVHATSWRLLPAPARLALCQLSVFEESFSLQDALAAIDLGVLGAQRDEERYFMRLEEHCLVLRRSGPSGDRFEIPRATRHWARACFEDRRSVFGRGGVSATGPQSVARSRLRLARRMAQHALRLHEPHIQGGEPLGPIEPQWADLLTTLSFLGRSDSPELLRQLALVAWRQVSRRGGFHALASRLSEPLESLGAESRVWSVLTRIVAACAVPRLELSLASLALQRLLGSSELRARATEYSLVCCEASAFRVLMGDYEGAARLAEHARAIADTPLTEAWADLHHAEVLWQHQSAVHGELSSCLERFERLQDRAGMVRVTLLEGHQELARDNAAAARNRAQAAARLAMEDGDLRLLGQSHILQGAATVALGDVSGMARLHAGLRELEDAGDRLAAKAAIPLLVRACIQVGQPERGRLAMRSLDDPRLPAGLVAASAPLAAEIAAELEGPEVARGLAEHALAALGPQPPQAVVVRLREVLSGGLEAGGAT